MHCYRVAPRAPQVARAVSAPKRNMAFMPAAFPRFAAGEFAPFFNLIDDHFTQVANRASIRAFQPRFDVKEVQDAYELRGELPGVAQQDIDIQFADEKTLIVKGRTERESFQGQAPEKIEHTTDAQAADISDTASTSSYQKATVEDDEVASQTAGEPTPAETPVTETAPGAENAPVAQTSSAETSRYWVSERSVGEFQRSFSFPARVNQDAVTASLKNGILSIIVPKAAAPVAKKITIE